MECRSRVFITAHPFGAQDGTFDTSKCQSWVWVCDECPEMGGALLDIFFSRAYSK